MSEPGKNSSIPTSEGLSVLLVVSSYLPNLGGLQSVTAQLASALQRRGHPVEVLAQRYPRTLPAAEVIDGVRVRRLLFLAPRLRDVRRGRLDLFFAGLFYFPSTLLRLLWQIGRTKPDVVNLHFVGAPAFFLLIAHALLRFRYVVSLHGDDVEGLWRGTWFDRWIFRATLKRADEITACSRYLLERALEIEPFARSHVVYNGLGMETSLSDSLPYRSNIPEAKWRDERDERVRLASVGRVVSKKGFDVLLRALYVCRQTGANVCLTLIGDGPERGALEQLAHELALDHTVEFRGTLDHAAVLQAIGSSRVVIVPSREEPFGLVALEAMASGKPIIASRVGGLPEVLDSADVLMVKPDNPTELAQAIILTLARLEREPDYGVNNRAIAARFSTERIVDQYEAIYTGRRAVDE